MYKRQDETKVQEYLQKRREIEQAYIDSYYETRLQDLDIEFLLKTLQEKFGDHIIHVSYTHLMRDSTNALVPFAIWKSVSVTMF